MCEDRNTQGQTDEALRESEERLRLAQQGARLGVFTWDIQTGVNSWSPELEAMYGLPPGGFPGTQPAWEALLHPDDRAAALEQVRRSIESGETAEGEWRAVWPDGSTHWLQARWRVFRDAAGRPHRMTGVNIDVTERKEAEDALRESEDRFRSLVASSIDAVLLTAPDGRILSANAAACRLFGRSEEELIRVGRSGVVDTSDPRLAQALEERARTGRFHGELTFVRADGSKFAGEISTAIFADRNGAPRTSMVIRDITERKRLEAGQAQILERLAMVQEEERRRISRELHDQIAQRLVALAVELKNLETSLAAGEPPGERVQALRGAVDDLQQSVRQLAWDLRAGELAEGGLETALVDYCEEWSLRAKVPVDCACRGLGGVRLPAAIEGTLYRVAQEALANVEKHARPSHVSVLLERDDGLVRLTVEDDGRGFDVDAVRTSPEAMQRLGLMGMQERVALVGGTFLIESSPGSGTTILVRVPVPSVPPPEVRSS